MQMMPLSLRKKKNEIIIFSVIYTFIVLLSIYEAMSPLFDSAVVCTGSVTISLIGTCYRHMPWKQVQTIVGWAIVFFTA